MEINKKIKLIRIKKGITQVEFARLIGITHDSGVRAIENGAGEVGSAKLEKICNLFPEYALWLMTDIDDVAIVSNKSPKTDK